MSRVGLYITEGRYSFLLNRSKLTMNQILKYQIQSQISEVLKFSSLLIIFLRHGGVQRKPNPIPPCLAGSIKELNAINYIVMECRNYSLESPAGLKFEASDVRQMCIKTEAIADFMTERLKKVAFFDANNISVKLINKLVKNSTR